MKRRSGFTLIELVVVVMIIGIIAAIAVPKMLYVTGSANDNAARQSLGVLRDAIDQYAAANSGKYPGTDEASFKTAIAPYLRGPFPKCPVGSGTADSVNVTNAGTALSGTGGTGASGTQMWKYDCTTGEIIINYKANAGNGISYDTF